MKQRRGSRGAYGYVEVSSADKVKKVMELVDQEFNVIHNNVREVLLYMAGISEHGLILVDPGGSFCSVEMPRYERTLSSHARRLSTSERLQVFPKLAEDLSLQLTSLHHRGYVHNDVKPDNVMVSELGRCATYHLVDFGSCTLIGRTIAMGYTCSTFPFAAPECFDGNAASTPSRDAYMLGTTLLTFLNGGGLPKALGDAVLGSSGMSNVEVAMMYWGQMHYGTDKLDASRLVETVRSRLDDKGENAAWAVVNGLMQREASLRPALSGASAASEGAETQVNGCADHTFSIRDIARCTRHVFRRDVPWPASADAVGRVTVLAQHILCQYLLDSQETDMGDLIEASVILSMSLLVNSDVTCCVGTRVCVMRMLRSLSSSGLDLCSLDWRLVRYHGSEYERIDFDVLYDVLDVRDVDPLSGVGQYYKRLLDRACGKDDKDASGEKTRR